LQKTLNKSFKLFNLYTRSFFSIKIYVGRTLIDFYNKIHTIYNLCNCKIIIQQRNVFVNTIKLGTNKKLFGDVEKKIKKYLKTQIIIVQ
jgi:hypothetical protein